MADATPAHSKFSASAAHRWMACPGSITMSAGIPDTSSVYADEGSVAHIVLRHNVGIEGLPEYQVGDVIDYSGRPWTVTAEMMQAVNTCIEAVLKDTGATHLAAETSVNYAGTLGVDQDHAWGTLDLSWYLDGVLKIADYKHGQGVAVYPSDEDGNPNPQLALYALGRYAAWAGPKGITHVQLEVHQPRARPEPSVHLMTLEQLLVWGRDVAEPAATRVIAAEQSKGKIAKAEWARRFLKPGDKQCRWCPAKATCPAIRDEVLSATYGVANAEDFASAVAVADVQDIAVLEPITTTDTTDAEWLSLVMSKADMIEEWLKSVRAEVERRLLAGLDVPGFKIVQGKQGNRAWRDADDAEAQLKAMRLKVEEMYDLKLISPTSAEKLAKAKVIGPRQWVKLQDQITRSGGKPSVAPASDPRPALSVTPIADHFDALPSINPEDFV